MSSGASADPSVPISTEQGAIMVIGVVLALWLLGSERGLLGAAVGAFIGALAAAGLVTATSEAQLATMYTPVEMAAGVVPLGILALVLAVTLPYATGAAALAWTVGAVVAATAAPRTGQAMYLAPLLVHIAVAALIARIAARRMPWDRVAPRRRAAHQRFPGT